MIGRGNHRVVQRGAAARFNPLQRILQLGNLGGVVLVEEVLFVEVHHEDLVLRIAGLHQVDGGGVHRRTLFAHGAGIVDDDAHRDGNVFAAERGDLLRLAVFEYGEVALGQVGDQTIVIVHHGGVQGDFVNFLLENKDVALLRLGRLPCCGTCTVSPG